MNRGGELLKYLAPVIIGVLMIGWLGIYAFGILQIPNDFGGITVLKIVALLIISLFSGMAVMVLVDRFRELREENEDDYRKY